MKTLSRQTVHSIIGILFVVSGALGLIYQIVWFKYLSLFLGNTTYAQTIVLATFMGGLAIGSAWWGRKVDRSPQPLRLYAWMELGIGIYCLFYPRFLELLKSVFISIVVSMQLPSDGTAVLILKLFTSLCSLLIPTILMGGTLPILVRFISHKLEESGRNIAVLYFLNSFGAVVGSLLAGFFFIRLLGLSTTVYSAAIINLLIGTFAIILSLWKINSDKSEVEATEEAEQIFPRREVILAITVAGSSGLASMIYEVTWVRMLIPVLGSSTYSFSIMLVAFISGITIGSLIVSSFIQRVKNLPSLLGWCQVGIVLSMFAVLPLYARIPYEFWKVASILVRSSDTYPIYLTIQFIFGFMLMIVPTIFLGMSLPIATRIAARGISVLGKSVGNIFAINTLGTVIGSLLSGLVLIPLIGVKHTIEVGIGCNLLAGLLVFVFAGLIPRKQMFVALPLMFLTLIGYLFFVPNWNKGVMLSGVFRSMHSDVKPPESYDVFLKNANAIKVLYYKEGTTATIGVVEGKYGNETQRVLIVNGKSDASTKGDLPTQLLCGQIPCMLQKNPENVLVVGLGSGVTIGSVLTHPVKRVDCVEIAPEIVEALSQFDEANHRPLSDTRSNLFIEDALAYLKITNRKYDIIINEPTNPWIAGVGNLFTTEFFEKCKQRMNKGGIMVQWFHLYEMNDELFKMVVRTFQSSFTYVSLWQALQADIIMIGSEEPISIEYDKIKQAMTEKRIKEDLQRISIPDAATFLSLEMLSSKSVLRYVGTGDLNTEDRPRLEYGAPETFFAGNGVKELDRYDERMRCDTVVVQLQALMRNNKIMDEELRNIGFLHTQPNRNTYFGYSVLKTLQKKHPKDIALVERLANIAFTLKRNEEAVAYSKMLVELQPDNPKALENYATRKYMWERPLANILTQIDFKISEDMLRKSISLTADTVDIYNLCLADLYYGMQQYVKALEYYNRTMKIREKYQCDPNIQDDVVLYRLAICYSRIGRRDRALGSAFQAVKVNPHNDDAKELFNDLWLRDLNSPKSK
jgi:spermidine synthase/tetratricopeptide (TPR) repeat protein/MFS family permease